MVYGGDKMKKIDIDEQKKMLVEILKYVDSVCRKNNIKYSLIGGSLIGAIRHNGIIPWDDDIDIGLLPSEFEKLMECLKKEKNENYHLLDVDMEQSYYYPFAKVIKSSTYGYEDNLKKIKDYGVYIDIFKYNNLPNDKDEISRFYKKLMRIRRRLAQTFCYYSRISIVRLIRRITCRFDSNRIARKYIAYSERYNNIDSKYIMCNWPAYGLPNEIIDKSCFDNYIDIDFEGEKIMIVSDYDNLLKGVFGDYMKLPPEEKRITHHHMEMYKKKD